MSYIDCEKCYHFPVCKGDTDKHNYFGNCPHYKPTADVVEVVRCKDCLFAKKGFDECDIYCKLNDASFGKDAYCSYGERREE